MAGLIMGGRVPRWKSRKAKGSHIFEKTQEGKDKGWWVSGDYGLPYSLGFGSIPGRAWGWMARDRDGKEQATSRSKYALHSWPHKGSLI
jgi:hypothetical protein